MSERECLDIILFWDPQVENWLAAFLKYHIVVQAETWPEALAEAKKAIVEQAELDDHFETAPLSGCPTTPKDIVALFEDSRAVLLKPEEVDAVPINATSRFVDRYLSNLTVKRLDP